MAAFQSSLPYHEPGITTILVLSSFLLLSNVVDWALDRLVYCCLIGQILLGIAWGTPGGKLLSENIETSIVQFGYLGLILLVYEGGLSTSFQSLRANILLSTAVALTGIGMPIGLSFTLGSIANATSLQSFAAGAALCSTSLGTTFTVLGTTGLLKTRLGVVLTSAAMLDDVVGLVMVQVISNLGSSGSTFSAITVIRPIFVSLAFAVACPLLCRLVLKPLTVKLNEVREKSQPGFLHRLMCRHEFALCLHTGLLLSMVTGATYAGTSNLFAAYLAGVISSWWDDELPHVAPHGGQHLTENCTKTDDNLVPITDGSKTLRSGTAIYKKYYSPANEKVLKPFFFASIGFSIPITRMFNGSTIWRGMVYSLLMLVAKLLCGAWLVRAAFQETAKATKTVPILRSTEEQTARNSAPSHIETQGSTQDVSTVFGTQQNAESSPNIARVEGYDTTSSAHRRELPERLHNQPGKATNSRQTVPASKPFSIYACALLGLAMVARGEIGFLISSLAESNNVFSTDGNDQVFLVVTWAIFLCTIIGPISVGFLVRRVERLEKAKEGTGSRANVLGVWGMH